MSLLTQHLHDMEQARKRTPEQNRALITICQANGPEGMWGYTDVPLEGGEFRLKAPDGREWLLRPDGGVEREDG